MLSPPRAMVPLAIAATLPDAPVLIVDVGSIVIELVLLPGLLPAASVPACRLTVSDPAPALIAADGLKTMLRWARSDSVADCAASRSALVVFWTVMSPLWLSPPELVVVTVTLAPLFSAKPRVAVLSTALLSVLAKGSEP